MAPLLTDRGKLLAAAAALAACSPPAILLLKRCLERMRRSVIHKLKLNEAEQATFRRLLAEAQSSTCLEKCFTSLDAIELAFSDDQQAGLDMAVCLLSMHPTHWAVFGNRSRALELEWRPSFDAFVVKKIAKLLGIAVEDAAPAAAAHVRPTTPVGSPRALFNTCRNNVAEGKAGAHSLCNV